MTKYPYIYVYQTICEVNGKSYVGIHKTDNLNDGYIGCGVYGNRNAKRNLLFHKAVRKYGYASFRKYILSFYDTYEEAKDEERFIVNERWVKDKRNYNTAIGGYGNTIGWMDEDKKNEWKSNIKGAVQKWMEDGGLDKIRKASKTAKRTRKFGVDNIMYGKPSHLRRRIVHLDLQGNYITTYVSIKEANEKTGVSKGNIHSCCNGHYKTTAKGLFRYETYSDEEKIRMNEKLNRNCEGNRRVVLQYSIDGVFIKEHRSINDTAKYLKCTRDNVGKHLSGKLKICKGYILKYKEEVFGDS